MKLSFGILLLIAAGAAAFGQSSMPRMVSCEPPNGKAGDVIAVTGENLTKDAVAKLYLTDGKDDKNDVQVEIVEQTGTTIKFKIPAKATGRMALMILTGGKDGKLIEQPVKVQIE
jgi:predicted solute-binding protein